MECHTRQVSCSLSSPAIFRRQGALHPLRERFFTKRKIARTICSNSLDPWKTLGVPHDADEKQIKKAYRKLALENHPDLRGSEAAARFVKIQEAYEVVTGKRRGATAESAPRSSSFAGTWDFHDWYWKFTASKRWDQQRKKAPQPQAADAPRPRPTGAPEEALRAQLAGLRAKAAFRARSRPPPVHAHHSAAQSRAEEKPAPSEGTSDDEAESTDVGHAHFAESQLAGLKRRARSRQRQQQAPPSPASASHIAAKALHHAFTDVTATEQQFHASKLTAEQDIHAPPAPATAADPVMSEAEGVEIAAPAAADEAEEAAAALHTQVDVLKCAREFMAEVQQRSASSNIVAATWTGLRMHLALTTAQLADRATAASSGGMPPPGPLRPPWGAPCNWGGDGSKLGRSPVVENSGAESHNRPAGSAPRGQNSRAEDACGQHGQQETAQIGQQLATQLAGLKRRAAIRH